VGFLFAYEAESTVESFVYCGTDPPQVLGTLPGPIKKKVVEFVSRNRDALLQHWNFEIDSKELLDLLEAV